MLPSKEKADTKELLTEAKKFVCILDRLTLSNHESIIQQLCENAVQQDIEDQELLWIERAKNRFLSKVKEEYAEDDDCRTKLSRVVWTGRFREIARQYFEERRERVEERKRKCGRLCC